MADPISGTTVNLQALKDLGIDEETCNKIASALQRIKELQRRVYALENRLQRRPSDEPCPHCGALEWRVDKSEPTKNWTQEFGAREYHLRCTDCGHADVKTVYPRNMPRQYPRPRSLPRLVRRSEVR